ncbi:MAG: hypothetical protein AAFV54_13720 [Pseudomonadota bacterium]
MITKLINRIKRLSDGASTNEDQTVDIGRVLPGYTPPIDRDEDEIEADAVQATAEETTSDAPLVLTDAVVAADISDDEDQKTEWLHRDLKRLYATWEDAKDAPEKMSFFERANHDLKGMAGTYGYPSIERLTTSLDRLLNSNCAGSNPALINLHVEACRAAFAQGMKGDASDAVADSVCSALEAQVARAVT